MADKTSIEWTDATWSPLRVRVKQDAGAIARAKGYTSLVEIAAKMTGRVGPHCEHVSPGCENCYAETNNGRCLPSNGTGLPFDRRARDLVDPYLDEKALLLPLKWKAARRIFVENQSDLFGEWWPDEMVYEVIALGLLCPRHTIQILTKQAARMRALLSLTHRPNAKSDFRPIAEALWRINDRDPKRARAGGVDPLRLAYDLIQGAWERHWPPKNFWLGVSVENRAEKERIDVLRGTPAAIRFLSLEPLLEDLGALDLRGIDWVIAGGESGPGAQPVHPEWVRSIRDQCAAARVPFFFKQWGAWHPGYIERCYEVKGYRPHWKEHPEVAPWWPDGTRGIGDHKINGGVAVSWARIGKKKAGRLLDGREWNEMPETKEVSRAV